MKKLLCAAFILVSYVLIGQTTVSYTPSTAAIYNPLRGWQKYSKTSTSYYNTVGANNLTSATLNSWKNSSDKVSVVFRYFMLENFKTSLISQTYLDNIQGDFDRIRNAGMSVIVRFSYSDSNSAALQQANKAQILSHITQLAPIINSNKDVILSYQAGYIGTYGEWWSTGNSPEFGDRDNITPAQWQNRKAIIDAMLASTSMEIPIQVRYTNIKKTLYGNTQLNPITAYQNNANARVGFYNDCFLNSWLDSGTYIGSGEFTNPVGSADYNYLGSETQYLPMTGETCDLNPPRTDGSNAVNEMNLTNWTTLNRDYNENVIDGWSSAQYQEILKRLGYRFELTNSTFNLVGNNLSVSLQGINTGYANFFKWRTTYLVLRNTATSQEYQFPTTLDLRFWKTSLSYSENFDLSSLPVGTYSSYLWMPHSTLSTRPEYSVQLANTGVWDSVRGYNNLNQTVTIALPPICPSTTWNGSSWSNGTPNILTTAVINAPYTVNGIAPTVNFDCCDLIVNSTLQINSNRFVTYQGDLSGSGSVLVKSGGKLIPVNDTSTCTTNNVTVERTTSTLKKFDYVYWGSPVLNQSISTSLVVWNPDRTFYFNGALFVDQETNYQGNFISNLPDGQADSEPSGWTDAWNTNFIPALGYASMIVNGNFPRTESVSFTGKLNTGIITTPLILSGNPAAQVYNPNIVSNPFSAALLLDSFIIDNVPNITGTVYFWTHTNTLSTAYSGLAQLNYNILDYSLYNLSGGVASGYGGVVPNGFLPSCQGFVVYAENNNDLVFKPTYLAAGYPNNNFLRTASPYTQFRLNLFDANVEDNPLFKQILVNYNSDTDFDYQRGWDTKISVINEPLKLYTITNGEKYVIDSRGDFDIDDVIRLGYSTAVASNYVFDLNDWENITDPIYLYDSYFNTWHDLASTVPYSFYSEVGEFNDRFQIVYSYQLGVNVFVKDNQVFVNGLKNYELLIYNMAGQLVSTKIDISGLPNGVYIVKVKDEDYSFKIIK